MLEHILDAMSPAGASSSCEIWSAMYYLSLLSGGRLTVHYGRAAVNSVIHVGIVAPEPDQEWLGMLRQLADGLGYTADDRIQPVAYYATGQPVRISSVKQARLEANLTFDCDYQARQEMESFLNQRLNAMQPRQLRPSFGFATQETVRAALPLASRVSECRICVYASTRNLQLGTRATLDKLSRLRPDLAGEMRLSSEAEDYLALLQKRIFSRMSAKGTLPYWGETQLVTKTIKLAMLFCYAKTSLDIGLSEVMQAANLLVKEMALLQLHVEGSSPDMRKLQLTKLKQLCKYSSVWQGLNYHTWINLVHLTLPQLDPIAAFDQLREAGTIRLDSKRRVIPVRAVAEREKPLRP